MIVDASVLVAYLADGQYAASAAATLRAGRADGGLAAPHLVDAEVGHALRAQVRRAALTEREARAALDDLGDLALERFPHGGLLRRAWDLRANVSFYDALYVALAELTERPLVTFDARLGAAPGHRAEVVVLTG